MTCTGPGSDSKNAAAGRGGMPVLAGRGGTPVLGIAGGLDAEPTPPVPSTNPLTVLLAPGLVTTPEAVESVMLPALAPTKPPPTLAAATVTLPLACEPAIAPLTELEATSPPAVLASPACTGPRATDDRIIPELLPTKPPA